MTKKKTAKKDINDTLTLMEEALKDLQNGFEDVIIASVNGSLCLIFRGKLEADKVHQVIAKAKGLFPIKDFYIDETSRYDNKLTVTEVTTVINFKL